MESQPKYTLTSSQPEYSGLQTVHQQSTAPSDYSSKSADAIVGSPKRTIFGFTRAKFWFIIAVVIVIVAAAVGGGVGGAVVAKNACAKGYANNSASSTATASAGPSSTSSTAANPSITVCPNVDNTVYKTTESKYKINCSTDYNPGDDTDAGAIPVTSFDKCMDACDEWNDNNPDLVACAGVVMAWQNDYFDDAWTQGVCWLKTAMSTGSVLQGKVSAIRSNATDS